MRKSCSLVLLLMIAFLLLTSRGCWYAVSLVDWSFIVPLDNNDDWQPPDHWDIVRGDNPNDVPYQGEADGVAGLSLSIGDDGPDGGDDSDDELKPGDRCPDCNDPDDPSACGVGKVGDGRICRDCPNCVDGIIQPPGVVTDEGDLEGPDNPPVAPPEPEAPKEDPLDKVLEKLDGIDGRLTQLENNQLTRDDVEEIVKKFQMEVQQKVEDDEEVPPPTVIDAEPPAEREVRIPGYEGTFTIPAGSKVISITTPDGRVHRIAPPSTKETINGQTYYRQQVGNYGMYRQPSNPRRVQIYRGNCSPGGG